MEESQQSQPSYYIDQRSIDCMNSRSFRDFRDLKNFQYLNPRYPKAYKTTPDYIPYQPALNVSDNRYLSNPLSQPLDKPLLSASMRDEYITNKANLNKSLYSWITEISKDLR